MMGNELLVTSGQASKEAHDKAINDALQALRVAIVGGLSDPGGSAAVVAEIEGLVVDARTARDAILAQDRHIYQTVAEMTAAITYTTGQPGSVVAGDRLFVIAGGYQFEVVAAGAPSHHRLVAGVKLLVTPGDSGMDARAFGVVGNGIADDTTALNKFFEVIAAADYGRAVCRGTFRVTARINFIGSWASTKVVDFAATINADFASNGEVFRAEGIPFLRFDGQMIINGKGGTTYSTRQSGNGLVVHSCTRFSAGVIICYYFKYFGVLTTGSTSQPSFERVAGWFCGSYDVGDQSRPLAFTATSNSGGSGSLSQRSTLTVAPGSISDFEVGGTFLRVGSTLHRVTAFNNATGTVEIYPWVENGTTSGTALIYMGGAYRTIGGDTSCGAITVLDAITCGFGILNQSLYPTSIVSAVYQYCAVGMLLGSGPGDSAVAGNTAYAYFENCAFDLVQATTANVGYSIDSTTALSLNKCRNMAPRNTDNSFNESYSMFNGLSITIDGIKNEPRAGATSGGTYSTLNALQAPTSTPTYTLRTNGGTVNLLKSPDRQRLFGINDLIVVVTGTGVNRRPTGTITFVPEPGNNINSGPLGASVGYSGFAGVAMFHAFLVGADWQVSLMTDRIYAGSSTYNPPSIAAGAGATTTLTVPGAAFGDVVVAAFSADIQGLTVSAWVSAANTVSVRFQNGTTAAVDLASGTLSARVLKP
jgi:hypothetical protein